MPNDQEPLSLFSSYSSLHASSLVEWCKYDFRTPASIEPPHTGPAPANVAETLQALGSPEPIANDDEFTTRLLQLQSGLLILVLHSQNFAKTLEALGSPELIANDNEFRMHLLQLRLGHAANISKDCASARLYS